MKKKSILGILILTGALTVGVNSKVPVKHNLTSKNHVLLVGKEKVTENKSEITNQKSIKPEVINQNLTKTEVNNLKDKIVEKHGMVFKGVKAMKIAPNMTNSFLATPGFDADGFASTTNEQLYNYELNLKNDQKSMGEAIRLHSGNPVDTCVFFQSSSLRAIGQAVPDSIGYTTHLENWLSNNGWTKHSDFAYVQKGDLCFASYYHTFLFMGWKDKAKGVAWVMGNESFVQPYYRNRNLNGQSPQIYGDNSYTGATVYWTKGQGYEGPEANPLHRGEYNAFGTTTVKSQTSLYQNQGSGTVYSKIPAGTNVPILKSDNGWYEVYYNENLGWINSNNTSGIAESMGGGIGTANTQTGSNIGGPYKNIQTTKYPSIGVGVISANGGLWLNSEPNANSGIRVIPQGANVSVIAQSGKWDKIQYYGQVGWVDANPNYIQTMMSPKTPSPAAKAPAGSKIEIHTNTLNGTTVVNTDIYLNNEPKATYDGATSICVIPSGTKVNVIGKSSNNWFKVVYKGQTGYISAKYTNGYVASKKPVPKPIPKPLPKPVPKPVPKPIPTPKPTPKTSTGWQDVNGNWSYKNSTGNKVTGWNDINNEWYYMNNEGTMQTGWQYVNNQWYHMSNSGGMDYGWHDIGNEWYYMSGNGTITTGWQYIDGDWYHMNSGGGMDNGWNEINNEWYYMGGSGVMQTGWQYIDGNWYHMNESGGMDTGWKVIDNNWYYMGGSGAMQTGWQYISGEWYYMNNSGDLTYGTATIGGTSYKFNSSGELV